MSKLSYAFFGALAIVSVAFGLAWIAAVALWFLFSVFGWGQPSDELLFTLVGSISLLVTLALLLWVIFRYGGDTDKETADPMEREIYGDPRPDLETISRNIGIP